MAMKYWDAETMQQVSGMYALFPNPYDFEKASQYVAQAIEQHIGVNVDLDDITGHYLPSMHGWMAHWCPEEREGIFLGGPISGQTCPTTEEMLATGEHSVVDVTNEGVDAATYILVGWEEERRIWVFSSLESEDQCTQN